MRVSSSLPYGGLGLTLFAAFGAIAPAQQVKRNGAPHNNNNSQEKISVAPHRVSLRPAQVEWSDLVRLQQSLPPGVKLGTQPAEENWEAAPITSEPVDDIVLPDPQVKRQAGRTQPSPSTHEGGIESLVPCVGFPVIPAPGVSTIGQPDGPDSFATLFYPPNPAGGVGPAHLMVMAPNFTLIQDRTGVTVGVPIDTITFWSPTGAASVNWCRLDYDAVIGRWHATARGGTGVGATSILFAISDTDDPTGGWDFYSIPADPAFLTYSDNLKKGYNQTWVAVTACMYTGTTAAGTQGERLYTFDVAGALAGGPVVANTFPTTYVTAATSQGSGLVGWRNCPTRSLDGSLADLHLLNTRLATAANPVMQMIKITGTGVAPSVVPGITGSPFGPDPSTASLFFIPFDYTNSRQGVFQVGDVRVIDPIPPDGTLSSTRARISDAVVRNGKLWIVQNHGLPAPVSAAATRNGLGFYELDPAGAISGGIGPFNQQVQVDDGVNTSILHPSIAVNCAEDVLIGFSRSDATKNIEAAYCMRLGSDALGTMGPTTLLKVGESSWWQVNPAPSTIGAWGYYSSSAIDPNDDITMWTLQPYAATRVGGTDPDSRWGNWWGRFGDCDVLPTITLQPSGFSGCSGASHTFNVMATSTSYAPTYQWRKNGVDISGETGTSYTINPIVPSDEASYDCLVTACGVVASQSVLLELGEPTITTQPVDYYAIANESAAFFVVATPSLGSNSYQWYHGANPVGTNSNLLVLDDLVYADYGPYSCVITDACGQITTNTVNLWPPDKTKNVSEAELNHHILDHPASQTVCVGDPAVFSVLYGPTDADLVWQYNGFPIVPPETNPTLVIPSITPGDAGIYDVQVIDDANIKTSLPALLTVIDTPVITTQPGPVSQTLSAGSSVTYTVVVSAGGTVVYQWQMRDDSIPFSSFGDLPGHNDSTLGWTVTGSASFRCRIANECGTVLTRICRIIVL